MNQGTDWSQPPFHEGRYGGKFWLPFFIIGGGMFALFILVFALMGVFDGDDPYSGNALMMASIIAPMNGLMISARCYFWQVILTQTTIQYGHRLGVPQRTNLTDIVRVYRPWYGLGINFCIDSGRGKPKLWPTVFLKEPKEFIEDLSNIVPVNHPLLRAMTEYYKQ